MTHGEFRPLEWAVSGLQALHQNAAALLLVERENDGEHKRQTRTPNGAMSFTS